MAGISYFAHVQNALRGLMAFSTTTKPAAHDSYKNERAKLGKLLIPHLWNPLAIQGIKPQLRE